MRRKDFLATESTEEHGKKTKTFFATKSIYGLLPFARPQTLMRDRLLPYIRPVNETALPPLALMRIRRAPA
jgi:hypothetical protein